MKLTAHAFNRTRTSPGLGSVSSIVLRPTLAMSAEMASQRIVLISDTSVFRLVAIRSDSPHQAFSLLDSAFNVSYHWWRKFETRSRGPQDSQMYQTRAIPRGPSGLSSFHFPGTH